VLAGHLSSTRVSLLILAALTLCTMFGTSCIRLNTPPVISRLEAQQDWVTPLGSCDVYCVASDVDGDSLTYTWSATGGTILGQGTVATWTAPDLPGNHTITAKVTDGRGGEAIMQLTIDVLINHLPVIESLTADPLVVIQGKTSAVECIASDADKDELGYLWAATGGNISGEGCAVIWTAPDACARYVITVTVTDGRAGEESKELEIRVRKPG